MKQLLLVLILSSLLISYAQCGFLRKLENSSQENEQPLPQQQPQEEQQNETQQSSQPEQSTKPELSTQTDQPANPEQTQVEESNEQEQSNHESENNESNNKNTSSNDEQEQQDNEDINDENLEVHLQQKNQVIQQVVIELMSAGLKLNQERNELLKEINFFGIQNFVENPESLTAEHIHEHSNTLFKNQQLIENLKNLNKLLEDIQQQLSSILL